MTSQPDFLLHLTAALDRAEVPYMLTGSVASSLYGQPRATRDMDVVIAPTRDQIEALLNALGDGCYVSRTAAHEALANASSFNVIDTEAGWKADLIVRKDRPFSETEFGRRRTASVLGRNAGGRYLEQVGLGQTERVGDAVPRRRGRGHHAI